MVYVLWFRAWGKVLDVLRKLAPGLRWFRVYGFLKTVLYGARAREATTELNRPCKLFIHYSPNAIKENLLVRKPWASPL